MTFGRSKQYDYKRRNMTLTKDDLRQFKGLLEENNKEIRKDIRGEVEQLATMVAKHFERIEKGQKQIREDISHLEFIATEMVRRDEFLEVKQRLSKIEAKLGIVK